MFSNKEQINIITKKMNAVSFPLFEKQPEIPVALFLLSNPSMLIPCLSVYINAVADLGGGCRGCIPPPPRDDFLIQLVFCKIWR